MNRYESAERLDAYLGDPFDGESSLCFSRIVELDEAEEFPAEAVARVQEWGFGDYLIPEALGGKFSSFDALMVMLRVLARRDLTTATTYGATLTGALPVWLAGNELQRLALAESLRRGELGAIGLTEKAHGSDLLSGECAAAARNERFHVSGEKWLINNGTIGSWISLLARTGAISGATGFSVLHVRKADLDPARYGYMEKIRTLGVRGADISGIWFDDCELSRGALIGEIDSGMQTVLKTLQLSRTYTCGLSLGAADTALRISLDFARQRQVYGDAVFAIPAVRDQLVGSFLDILTADCVALSACRAIHVCPEQMSLWSAVTKSCVPELMEEVVSQAARVLGARYFLREQLASGVFQKILRDNLLVSVFDGSTAVNQYVIASQLKQLGEERKGVLPSRQEGWDAFARAIFDWSQPLPEIDYSRLALTNAGRDDIVNAIPALAAGWQQGRATFPLAPFVAEEIGRCLDLLVAELRNLTEASGRLTHDGTRSPKSSYARHLARRHSLLHAAAACIQMWLRNWQHADAFFSEGVWLALSLRRLVQRLGLAAGEIAADGIDSIAEEMSRRLEEGRLFSVIPLSLARSDRFRTDSEKIWWNQCSEVVGAGMRS